MGNSHESFSIPVEGFEENNSLMYRHDQRQAHWNQCSDKQYDDLEKSCIHETQRLFDIISEDPSLARCVTLHPPEGKYRFVCEFIQNPSSKTHIWGLQVGYIPHTEGNHFRECTPSTVVVFLLGYNPESHPNRRDYCFIRDFDCGFDDDHICLRYYDGEPESPYDDLSEKILKIWKYANPKVGRKRSRQHRKQKAFFRSLQKSTGISVS